MTTLDFDSVRQAPGYVLSKATAEWHEDEHLRNDHGQFRRTAIAESLEADAGEWRHLELTHEAWLSEFPRNEVLTPIGMLRLGENQIHKLIGRDRHHYFGLIKPTLESPTYVVEDAESNERLSQRLERGEVIERDSVLKFFRAFKTNGKTKAFCCVSVKRDGLEIVISAVERKLKQVAADVERCAILWGSTLTKEVGNFGSEDGAGEPTLKAILDSFPMFVKTFEPDYDSLCKSDVYVARYRASHEPTVAQFVAGNYPKRKVPWHGMTVSVENEAGSVRCGKKPDGAPWESRMVFPYGYLNLTEGVDGDHVDVFLGPCPEALFAYVIHQRRVDDWAAYDEDKCMLDFASEADAVHAFLQCYDDFRFLGPVTAMLVAEFVAKARATFDKPAMIKAAWGVPNGVSPSFGDTGILDFGQEMLAKSEHGPIPEGAHWITVNSGGGKGNPILVMPHEDGSMRVIGGAGGALNHLKLRSVKTGEGYKDSIAAKQQARQEKQKAQTAADKASGIHEGKGLEKGKLKQAMKKQREEFVNTVADAMGWTDHQFDDSKMEGLSPEAQTKARKEHDTDLFKRAKEAVGVNRKMLLNNHDALAASGLGEVPLQAKDSDVISVEDLDPVSDKAPGLGFAASYGDRAEKQGLTPEAVEKELTAVHGTKTDPAKAEKTASQKVDAENIGKELDAFKAANPETHKPSVRVLEDATKAAALVKAHKKLKMAEQMARHASLELANAKIIESKAYVLEASDAEVEEGARKQMEQDIKTIGAAGLLSEIDKMGGEESLGGHVGAGAFNSLNAFATSVGGEPLIDRSVVDVLGINAAAQILARRIAKDYQSGDFDAIKQGVEDYHVGSQAEKQESAVSQAQALHKAASEIELPDGKDGFDLAHAQELNHARREAVNEAKRILGQATGELQANAALVMALRQGAADKVEVSLGKTEAKAAITQLHALGLKSGDYKLEDVGGNLVATVSADGLDRLSKPVDVDGLKQIKRNLAIIRGDMDEDGWLPQGFANRPDLAMHVEAGVAPKLAQPFQPGADLAASLRDYIGGRVADGAAIQDILADAQSADFFSKAGDQKAYREALDAVAPLKGDDGKLKPIDSLKESFEKMADDFVASKYGSGTSPLHRQNFEVDKKSVDALHRALSATPEGVAAFKPIGDLSPQERNGLRKWWEGNVGKKDAGADGLKSDLADHVKNEPEKSSTDMFGEESVNPDWHSWKAKHDDLAGKANAAGLDWNKYVGIMGSPTAAIAATQDLVRSHVVSGFADAHNKLNPNTPLKIGKTTIQGSLNHLDAVDPAARADRQAKEKELIDSLRERINGKYSGGSVADKMQAQAEANQAFEQAQMGFFSTEELGEKPDVGNPMSALGSDERFTVGHAAEQKIAGMMSVVGQNFKPGKPTKLWNASMSGKYAPQQRAIKLMEANKRVVLGLGAGSGKTGIALGATAHLIKTGKIKRALHLVPSIVQDQYGGEASRYLEAGQFKWHCQPGASQAERIAAYKDSSNHFTVMTHESFRADMLHMGAQHLGISGDQMNEQVATMGQDERKAWAKSVMDKEGIDFGATFVDEAHQMLNRAGKENSARANVIDAVTENTPYLANMSGDTVKNDISEAHSVLEKMDRSRYPDRAAFMRMYGGDTLAAKAGLKRELARYGISNTIRPDVKADYQNITVPLSDHQRGALKEVDKTMARLAAAKSSGKVDIEAAKALSPSSFDGPEDQHEVIAKGIAESAGIMKESAVKRVINSAEQGNAKIDKMLELADKHKGQPGVVFAHNRAAVAQIIKALEAKGHTVTSITGSDSSQEKARKRELFHPESGEAKANIMVCSDAGAVGQNLQRGSWLVQHDVPDTAMSHGQRSARIHRLGQKNDVSVYTLASDHKSERTALRRLQKKYALRELMLDPMGGLDDSGVAGAISKRMLSKQQDSLI